MARRSQRRRYEARDPWWKAEYGGAPLWMILAIVIGVVGVVAFALLNRP